MRSPPQALATKKFSTLWSARSAHGLPAGQVLLQNKGQTWPEAQHFFHCVEKSRKSFPYCGKLFFVLALLLPALAPASPFSVSATRDTFEAQPALRLNFDFPADHHLYSSFAVTTPDGTALAPLSVPPPDTHNPDDIEPSYSTPFAAYYAAPDAPSVTVSFQGCAGTLCFLPEEKIIPLESTHSSLPAPKPTPSPAHVLPLADRPPPARLSGYADVPAFLFFLDPSSTPPAPASPWQLFLDDPSSFYLRYGILPSLLLILVGGFLLNLTPCVLPMIPVNLAIIGAGNTAQTSRRSRFLLGLVYGLGMALVYGALGLVVVLSGSVFGSLNASPLFNGAIAILFLALALALFDVWQIDFARFRKTSPIAGRARLPAVLAMGGLSALLAGACVAPVLIAVLALSSALYAQGLSSALALPFLLGIGMALPWPLAAAGLLLLPKPGAWMEKIKKTFAVLIILLAIYYAWNAFSAFRTSPRDSSTPSAFHRVDLQRDPPGTYEALLAEAAASGKPVLLDFGAHWCKACHLMDSTTLRDPRVLEKLTTHFAIQIIADHPNRPPARNILRPLSIQGFPTYLLYPAPPLAEK